MVYFFGFIIGAIIGSFIGALTYRMSEGISIAHGRSFCPKCKKQIAAFDNIPILSYLILLGKCRNCKKKISIRYPIIELATAFSFLICFVFLNLISQNLIWTNSLFDLQIPFLLFLVSLFVIVFVVDLEHSIIPDEIVFIGLFVTTIALLLFRNELILTNLLAGTGSAIFLLLIHLITNYLISICNPNSTKLGIRN